MLSVSTIAGTLWEQLGAATTFYAGALFSVLAAILIISRGVE